MTRGNAPAMLPGQSNKPAAARAVMASRDGGTDDVDLFPTRPWGGRVGGEIIRDLDPLARSVYEPAVGQGMLAHGLADYFPQVLGSDICCYDPALYAANGWFVRDFLSAGLPQGWRRPHWIVSNPPFDLVEEFIRHAYGLADRGVAMLLRLACLEGQERHQLLHGGELQLTAVAPFSERLPLHRGFWDPTRTTATAYAWFIWCKPGVGPRLPVIGGKPRPVVIDVAPGAEARLTRADDADLFRARA